MCGSRSAVKNIFFYSLNFPTNQIPFSIHQFPFHIRQNSIKYVLCSVQILILNVMFQRPRQKDGGPLTSRPAGNKGSQPLKKWVMNVRGSWLVLPFYVSLESRLLQSARRLKMSAVCKTAVCVEFRADWRHSDSEILHSQAFDVICI